MKRIVILLFLILTAMLLLNTKGKAETTLQIFEQGNNAYSKGKYVDAILEYKKVLTKGECSGELYFNLGNAFYKIDSIPQSILYFEKAKVLLPNDDDLKANLKLANAKTTDKIEGIPQLFILNWYQNFLHTFTTSAWAWLSIFLAFVAFTLFWFFVTTKSQGLKRLYFFVGAFSLILCIVNLFVASAAHDANTTHRGVVFTPSVTLKSEPNSTSTSLYVIHEGATCKIMEELNNWLRVRLDNGNEGWLNKADLRQI